MCSSDLEEVAGDSVTAKDFRTWAGGAIFVQVARARAAAKPGRSARDVKRAVNDVIRDVARKLGNTAAVCRACYIHPALVDHFLNGTLGQTDSARPQPRSPAGLTATERRLVALLRR